MLKMFNNRARAHLLQQQSPQAVSKAKSLTIHAEVTRADGTVEPKRIVSYGRASRPTWPASSASIHPSSPADEMFAGFLLP